MLTARMRKVHYFMLAVAVVLGACHGPEAAAAVGKIVVFRGTGSLRYKVDASLALFPSATVAQYAAYTMVYAGGNWRTEPIPDIAVLDSADVFLLANYPLEALDANQLTAIYNRVNAGATCVILGGDCALSRSPSGTFPLESILPVSLPTGWPLRKLPAAVALSAELQDPELTGLDWSWRPEAQYDLATSKKPAAITILSAGSTPILVAIAVGAGKCYVFSGMPFGTNETGFWKWPDWPRVLSYCISGKGL